VQPKNMASSGKQSSNSSTGTSMTALMPPPSQIQSTPPNSNVAGSTTHWKSVTIFSTSCEQLRQQKLQMLEKMPELIRGGEVCRLMGWSRKLYYKFTEGHRICPFGYEKEQRVPKAVIRLWLINQ